MVSFGSDLLPIFSARVKLVESVFSKENGREEAVFGRADHCGAEGARGRRQDGHLARKHGISEATLYNWKAKFGGRDASEAKRLRQLEDENAKLKKLLAEQMLDAAALRELLAKKW